MPASTRAKKADSGQRTGCYVYGILPGDVKLKSGVHGVGEPPGEIRLVRAAGLAALVSDVDVTKPLGTPEDLQAHQEILDSVVAESPVLPLRFGAVLASEDAVADELLEPNRDEFAGALDQLEGRAEYVVRGRYDERAILEEILSENSAAARLRDQIRGTDPDASREQRIKLGEIVNDAIEDKRKADTRALVHAVKDHSEASFVRSATSELDAAYVALLVAGDQADELKTAIEDLNDRWQGRVQLSVLGPMAAYDFAGAAQGEQG